MRAERALERHALGRVVVDIFRGDDFRRRAAAFYPSLEGLEDVVVRVALTRRRFAGGTERNRAGTAAAVIKTGDEERPVETLRPIEALLRGNHAFEIVDAVLCWNQRVGGAMVVNQFVIEPAERFEIGIGGVGDRRQLFVGAFRSRPKSSVRNGQSLL